MALVATRDAGMRAYMTPMNGADLRPRPSQSNEKGNDNDTTLKLLRLQAGRKKEVLTRSLRGLLWQYRIVICLKYTFILAVLGLTVIQLVYAHLTDETVVTRFDPAKVKASSLPDVVFKSSLLGKAIGDMTYSQFANIKVALVHTMSVPPTLSFVAKWRLSLWFNLVALMACGYIIVHEGKLEQRIKRFRKKLTECEFVGQIKGKGSEKWERILNMLKEDLESEEAPRRDDMSQW